MNILITEPQFRELLRAHAFAGFDLCETSGGVNPELSGAVMGATCFCGWNTQTINALDAWIDHVLENLHK